MEFQLTTLGTIALRRPDGTSVESILQQPRRLSLLVFLAIASRDKMVRRDEIAAMFWPESDSASCRNALSQVLHYLRKSLGADAIITRGNDEIALNPAVISCDAAQLLHGLAAAAPGSADVESALDLYRGTFMPGLFDAGSASFEQWVDRVRACIDRAVSDAAWARADTLAAAGEVVGAAAMARRAAVVMEADEVSLRALMTLLARVGDRAGALDAFERFTRMLQADYEMSPSAETAALAESIREPEPVLVPVRSGLAIAAAEEVLEGSPVTVRMDPPATVATGISISGRRFPLWAERLATVVGSVVVAGTILTSWAGRTAETPALPIEPSMMVSRFGVDATDDELGATGRRLRETLIHNLAGGKRPFSVIDGAVGSAGGVDIAAGDHFQLVGSVTRDDDGGAHFTIRVIDRRTSAVINSREFPIDGDVSSVAKEASDFARYVVGGELDTRTRLSPAARDLVLASHRARLIADSLSTNGSPDVAGLTLNGIDAELAAAKLSGTAAADVLIERAEVTVAKVWIAASQGAPAARILPLLQTGLEQIADARSKGGSRDRTNELAGVLYYWMWSSAPGGDFSSARLLQDSAVHYLKLAASAEQPSARSWTLLSAMHASAGAFTEAQYAAEQALQADIYSRDVANVQLRLFENALESGNTGAASKACEEISRTMGPAWWGAYCRIVIIAWSGETTPQQAGQIRDMLAVAESAAMPQHDAFKAAAGVALANGGFISEANDLYRQIEASEMKDAMVTERAWLAVATGNSARAHAQLRSYVAEKPAARAGVLKSRRYASN